MTRWKYLWYAVRNMRALLLHRPTHIVVAVLLLGLVAGIVAITPQLLIWKHLANNSRPYIYNLPYSSNVELYQGFIHDVYEGNAPSMELSDANTGTTYVAKTPVRIAALFLTLFDDDRNIAYLAIDVAGIAAIFFFFFFIGRAIFDGSLVWSFALAAIGALTRITIELPVAFFSFAKFKTFVLVHFYPIVTMPLPYFEPMFKLSDPILTLPFLLFAIYALYLAWEKPTIARACVAGIALGLLFDVYFFYWIYAGAIAAFLFLASLARWREDPRRLRAMFLCGIIALLFFIPYAINQSAFLASDTGWQTIMRHVQVVFGHRFGSGAYQEGLWMHYLSYLILFVSVFVTFRHSHKTRAVFYGAAIAAMVAVWNVQVATGYVAEPFHFLWGISVMFLIIISDIMYRVVLWMQARYAISNKVVAVLVFGAIGLLLMRHGVNASYFYFPTDTLERYVQKYDIDANLISSWDWINANIPKDARIVSPSFDTTTHLNNYTHTRPYLASPGGSLLSNDEILERYIISNKLFDVPRDLVELRLKPEAPEHFGAMESMLYRMQFYKRGIFDTPPEFPNLKTYPIYLEPENKRMEVMNEYTSASADMILPSVDYLFYGPDEKEIGARADFSRNNNFELLYQNSSVKIYEVLRAK